MQNTNKHLFFWGGAGGHRANDTERKNGHILLPKELQNFYAYLIIQHYHLYLFFSLILDEFEILFFKKIFFWILLGNFYFLEKF